MRYSHFLLMSPDTNADAIIINDCFWSSGTRQVGRYASRKLLECSDSYHKRFCYFVDACVEVDVCV